MYHKITEKAEAAGVQWPVLTFWCDVTVFNCELVHNNVYT
jgi:hypothetical protein